MRKISQLLEKILPFFIPLFILTLMSGCLNFVYREVRTFEVLYTTIATTFLSVFVIVILGELLPLKLKRIYRVFFYSLTIFLLIAEGFLVINYKITIIPEVINAVINTNKYEAMGVFHMYFSFAFVLKIIGIISVLVLFIDLLTRALDKMKSLSATGKKTVCYIFIFFTCFGFYLMGYNIYNYIRYNNGNNFTFTNVYGRIANSCRVVIKSSREVVSYIKDNENVNGSTVYENPDSINVIILVGESFSKYHTNLYSYEKNTNPLLKERQENGEMVVFNDVVTFSDMTQKVFLDLFCFDGATSKRLLPKVFKDAGFKVYLYDNQYLSGQSENVDWYMTNSEMSSMLFDKRNDKLYETDKELIDKIVIEKEKRNLYIVHINGQHFPYDMRYPESYAKFKKEEYPSTYASDQSEILAEYDNATLYCDYIVDQIISKFIDSNSIVVYFSDHSEEVYDYRSYVGHCNASFSKPSLKYQIEVPFMIWMSDKFRDGHEDLYKRICDVKDLPFITNRLSHTMLDIVGINDTIFNPSKSIINEKYDSKSPRIVLKSLNYDEIKANGFK